ncbi:MAG: hypothetical protein KA987_01105 [Saprospiraceae bacterium]|nr:hypothetical protein [Saprospiraceae bacterium]
MGRRHKKVKIIDLASKEYENRYRLPPPRQQRAAVSMDFNDISTVPLDSAPTNPTAPTIPLVVVSSEPLPLYSEDELFMGDLVDGIYQCFELTDSVYVSHFTCDTYYQLKNHMFFVHA